VVVVDMVGGLVEGAGVVVEVTWVCGLRLPGSAVDRG
jgi:hypothetical protein